MKKKRMHTYKILLTSITIATILSDISLLRVSAEEDKEFNELITENIPFNDEAKVESDILIDDVLPAEDKPEIIAINDSEIIPPYEDLVSEKEDHNEFSENKSLETKKLEEVTDSDIIKENNKENPKEITKDFDVSSNQTIIPSLSDEIENKKPYEDNEGPEILDVSIDKNLYKPNEWIELTVEVFDESQIDSVYLYFEREEDRNGRYGRSVTITDFELTDIGTYIGKKSFQIMNSSDYQYFLSNVNATDVYGNYSYVTSALSCLELTTGLK